MEDRPYETNKHLGSPRAQLRYERTQIRSVPNLRGEMVKVVVSNEVVRGSYIMTDEYRGYQLTVNHRDGEYVRGAAKHRGSVVTV